MGNTKIAERHHALDLIRGLAALGVAIYHRLAWSGDVHLNSLGTFGVYLFFILSALTMLLVYERTFADRVTFDDVATFFRNRFARILPLLLVVAILWFAYLTVSNGYDSVVFARSILSGSGLMALTPAGFTSTVTGAWSLAIELQFYVLLPLLVLCFARVQFLHMCLICVVVIAAQQLYLFSISTETEYWVLYTNPLTFAPFFLLGFIIHKAGAVKQKGALALSLIAFALIAAYSLFWPGDTKQYGFSFLILTGLAFASVYFAYRSQLPTQLVALASVLGNLSYGVYLLHPFVSLAANKLPDLFGFGGGLTFTAYLAMVLVIAWVIYSGFERPARRLLRAKARSLSTLP